MNLKAPPPSPKITRQEADALWDALTKGIVPKAPKKMRSRGGKRKKKGGKASDVFSLLGKMTQQVVSSPWKPVALVLPMIKYTCTCGAIYDIPSSEPLVRFMHKNTKSMVEKAKHPTRFNPHLPREIRMVGYPIERCQHCFTASAEVNCPEQLDLFADFTHAAPSLPLAIPLEDDGIPSLSPYRLQEVYITERKAPIAVTEQKAHYLPLIPYEEK